MAVVKEKARMGRKLAAEDCLIHSCPEPFPFFLHPSPRPGLLWTVRIRIGASGGIKESLVEVVALFTSPYLPAWSQWRCLPRHTYALSQWRCLLCHTYTLIQLRCLLCHTYTLIQWRCLPRHTYTLIQWRCVPRHTYALIQWRCLLCHTYTLIQWRCLPRCTCLLGANGVVYLAIPGFLKPVTVVSLFTSPHLPSWCQ